ncbi:2-dehydropantoate 2-reductase [Bacillus sp. T33-2]|uniref:2-dehydropantoate 2-reductase n=1 Tax=Bacillus sp. T33-2 TaxID=2054168 RepID=UPI000C7893DF|nr:2-dehydropantoate 2-reductase [Bacillus sp. T33-2]PLR97389.1 2-dehydropantoate 2-reductase [Bacillus sp. T33-2]
MKIGIIGGGSIGLLFAYYLSGKHDVTLYTKTRDQASLIQSEGIHVIKGEEQLHARFEAFPIDEWNETCDITIVSVKQYQLSGLLAKLHSRMAGGGCYLFLQNGMSHLTGLSDLKASRIYVGSVEHGAAKINGNTVRHNGNGITRAAVFKGNPDLLAVFSSSVPPSFPVAIEKDYHKMLVNKLIVNAVINPLTAVLRVPNGELADNPFYFDLLKLLFEEVADSLDIDCKWEQFQNVVAVCKKTSQNRSSMLKDVEEGRPTEIDAILGYCLESAEERKIETPLMRAFYSCIKGREYKREGN